jgi:hypothetical protein
VQVIVVLFAPTHDSSDESAKPLTIQSADRLRSFSRATSIHRGRSRETPLPQWTWFVQNPRPVVAV